MDDEAIRRYGAKKYAIGRHVGRKERSEELIAQHRKELRAEREAGREEERYRIARGRQREKWYRELVIITAAFTIVAMKAIEILMTQLAR